MVRTYYIVEHTDMNDKKYYQTHKRGVFSTFNFYGAVNSVYDTITYEGPDKCEYLLRKTLIKTEPKVIRVLKI